MWFQIVTDPENIELIAGGLSVREWKRLRRVYGGGRWRKLKGFAIVELMSGDTVWAEVHWFEAHGVGRREMKVKRVLE